jgi:gp16 family phage-associated protein
MTKQQSNKIKHRLRQEGFTLKAWAEAHNFTYRAVSDVLRGQRRGNYGEGRDIYIALGLDPDEQLAA